VESDALRKEFEWQRHLMYEILIGQEKIVSALDNLNQNIANLKTDVEALIAKPNGVSETDVQAAADAVAAIDTEVVAKLKS
jgi:hypothetical protein